MVCRHRQGLTVYPARSAAQHSPASPCHFGCTHTAVTLRQRCLCWIWQRDTQAKAVTGPPRGRRGQPTHHRALSRRPERLRENTREHSPACRRFAGAFACRQGQCCQCARRCSAALFGARRAAWHERNCHTGGSRRPGYSTRDAGMQLQVIRRKDAKSGVVLLTRPRRVARSVGWVKRLRRVARDDAR